MEIKYDDNKLDPILPNMLTPKQTQNQPIVSFKDLDPNKKYTLILIDPNAVSGNYIHWLIINAPGGDLSKGQTIFPYYGPHPPEGSGEHNYIFILFEQDKLTNSNLKNNEDRIIEMDDLLNQLGLIGKDKYSIKFKSSYVNGGKKINVDKKRKYKRKTKKRRQIRRRKTRSRF